MGQNQTPENNKNNFWFSKWFLNNKFSIGLINVLLTLLVLFMLSKVTWLFKPLNDLIGIVVIPIVFAAIIFYLLNPVIDWLQRYLKWERTWSIVLIFVAVVALIAWGIATIIPVIQEQSQSLIKNWPDYWQNLQTQLNHWIKTPGLKAIKEQLGNMNNDVFASITSKFNKMLSSTVNHIGSAVGVVTNVVIALVTTPFIAFFMLKDGHKLMPYILKFLPDKSRATTRQILKEVDQQISHYVRGQLTVAFWVAVMFTVGFATVGMQYALTLGIVAGLLNLIPYLGSFLAMVPAVVIAVFISPMMLVKVLIVFMIEQTLEGRVVSPLVLGNKMAMYPVTTIIVLLASGKLFGLLGVIIGIPIYAILKILVTYSYKWFRQNSKLYQN